MGIDIDRDLEFFPAIDKIMAKLKELEEKIDLVKSDLELMIKSSGKITKKVE